MGKTKAAKWIVSSNVVEGHRVIELDIYQDEKERTVEWSLPGRNGELYGLADRNGILPFRGCLVWCPRAANRLVSLLGLAGKGRYKEGEELSFVVSPSQVAPVLNELGLDPSISPEKRAEIFNSIKGRLSECPARIDDLLAAKGGGQGT